MGGAGWVRVDGRYTHRQGRTHYEMLSVDQHEARVFALPRRYDAYGSPSFVEEFTFEIVPAGSRRGEGARHVEVLLTGERSWRNVDDAKQAALIALASTP